MRISETATKAGAALHLAQEQVESMGRSANEKFDEARNTTAEVLENTAYNVRTTGHQGAKTIDEVSRNTAYKLECTATYLRDHTAGGMLRNLRHWMLRHPTGLIIVAATVGFMAGSSVPRSKPVE